MTSGQDPRHPLVSYRRSAPSLSVSALVDVMLILVVFVMLAARFDATRDLAVALPPAGAAGQAPDAGAIALAVTAGGAMRLDGEPVAPGQLGARLSAAMRARAAAGRADAALRVVADGALPLARVTEILAIAAEAGLTSVSIAARADRADRAGPLD